MAFRLKCGRGADDGAHRLHSRPLTVSGRTGRDTRAVTARPNGCPDGRPTGADLDGDSAVGHLASPAWRKRSADIVFHACRRKIFYPSIDAAEAARRLTEESTGDGPLHVYGCPHCPGWHVGHVVPRPVRMGVVVPPELERRRQNRAKRSRRRRDPWRSRRSWTTRL